MNSSWFYLAGGGVDSVRTRNHWKSDILKLSWRAAALFTLFYPIVIDVEKSATNDRNFPQFSTNWLWEIAAHNSQNGCQPLSGSSGFSNSLGWVVSKRFRRRQNESELSTRSCFHVQVNTCLRNMCIGHFTQLNMQIVITMVRIVSCEQNVWSWLWSRL